MITGVSLSGIGATLVVPQRMDEGYRDCRDGSALVGGPAAYVQLIAPAVSSSAKVAVVKLPDG
ncbi:hypothetical protein ACQP1G_08820 [Nocardia sp. CA-107356]|uniref:hypothetical protein n=1 Tax=Nocardia sp. CA-107356 TaxID=3239972 RepID=UPI003D8A9136